MSTCYGPDCTRTPVAYGLCDTHRRQQREGRPLVPIRCRADLLEDALWMRDTGEYPERAAMRLGMRMDAMEQMLRRAGHDWPALRAAVKHARIAAAT